MKAPSRLQVIIFLLGVAGAALFIVLLIRHDIGDVVRAVAAAGWLVAAVVAFHLLPLLLDTLGWQVLFPVTHRLSLRPLLWMRWICDAINTILPSAQVGGDIVRARLATTRGVPLSISAATVLVDITITIFSQLAFTVTGVALLATVNRQSGLLAPLLIGGLIALCAFAGFYFVQRFGIFRIIASLVSRMARSGSWHELVAQGEVFDRDVHALYGQPRALIASALWTMSSWVFGACEVWIALYALGVTAGFRSAYILESVGQGLRGAMFLVPGALGVQEGGYIVVGGLLGIPADTALALALIRRVRELAFGVPGVIAWQFVEGKRLWWRRRLAPVASKAP